MLIGWKYDNGASSSRSKKGLADISGITIHNKRKETHSQAVQEASNGRFRELLQCGDFHRS